MKFYICELRYMYNKKHGRFNEQKICVSNPYSHKKKVSNNHKKYVLNKIIIILFQQKIT